jgi:FkbM family methyltransferase
MRAALDCLIERRLPWRVEHWLSQQPVVQRWEHARWQARERRLFRRFVRPGDLVFDIGANIGDKTTAFRSHHARVVCVEPDARNLATLRTRFIDDAQVQIVPAGAGATSGTATFYPSPDSSRSTFAIDAMQQLGDGCAFEPGIDTPITTLDTLIATYGVPSFVKIDVEGFELSVLRGLHQPVPLLSFEFHGELFGDLTACLTRLEQIGMPHVNVLLYPVGGVKPYHPLDRLYFPTPVSQQSLLATLTPLRDRPLAGDVYSSP